MHPSPIQTIETASATQLPVICLAGPTASGKSTAAMAIAQQLLSPAASGCQRPITVEIVSVDSALVYRGMDIGTAKPGAADLAVVQHHLVDIRDPAQPYSAAEFLADAQRLVTEIRARGALPLLVGGTMLYFKALFDGLDPMPTANPAVRATIEAEARAHGWPELHAQLQQIDPATAARLPPGDSQRIQRALEVFRISGRPLSSFHTIKTTTGNAGEINANSLISLEPTERAWLHSRIAQRFDMMLAAGLVAEVQALQGRYLSPDLPAMRCVGYRQVLEALAGQWPAALLREKAVSATRQLAKRQLTWLRSMPERTVVACDAPDAQQQVVAHAVARVQASLQIMSQNPSNAVLQPNLKDATS